MRWIGWVYSTIAFLFNVVLYLVVMFFLLGLILTLTGLV
jgi:preprotein translocase subunit SecD